MKTKQNLIILSLLGVAALVGLLFIVPFGGVVNSGQAKQATAVPTQWPVNPPRGPYPTAIPGNQFHLGTPNLVGATPEQIGQWAVEYVQWAKLVKSGSPQVLLSRFVTRQQFEALKLGCLGGSITIEDPPLDVVILKGDFDVTSIGLPLNRYSTMSAGYLAYVVDIWSSAPFWETSSLNGHGFGAALNDPSLPPAPEHDKMVCATPIPASQKKYHYGDTVPGLPIPTVSPETPTPFLPPAPVQTVDSGTPYIPSPVPTP